ncbi:MAG: tetratricopeptide repeat protein, partial [Bacteroidales bacterium]|nr:tetratricopeptide repeat protein [Bacteroidales bacterium]
MERPDSALAVLESMDRSLLSTEADRARHALLNAMALDKNFIDVSDDSLARVAVDYYSKRGDRKYYARALYYLGKAYYYQDDYKKAIIEFMKAEAVAEGVDSLYLAMIKVAQSHSHNESYNALAALDCLREAYEINTKCGYEYYLQTSKLYLSETLYTTNQIDESLSLLDELITDPETDEKVKLSAKVAYA